MFCFPGRENLNFQMLSAISQGYLNNSDKVKHRCLFFQISVLLLLLLAMGASDMSAPVSARVQNYMTDWFSFSSLKGPRWQCLVTAHMPRGVFPCVCYQTALFCHSSLSARESNSKDCTILSRKESTAQPTWLVWLLALRPATPVENVEALRNCQLADLRAANTSQGHVGMPQ